MALKFLARFRSNEGRKERQTFEALTVAAATALQERRYELAVQLYSELVERNHDRAEMLYKRANALNGLGRWQEALIDYDGAIALDPAHSRAYCNRGSVLDKLARWHEALQSYDQALALNPGDFLSYYNRGHALKELARFDEALTSYERAIELNDTHAPAYVNRGNVLHELRQFEAAISSYDRAIELNADLADAFQGRGMSLFNLGRFEEALSSYDQALHIRSDYAEAYCNRGGVLQELGQHEAAVASFAKAIELKPSLAAAFQGLGFSLLRVQRFEAAIESYNNARAIEPDRKYLLGMLLYAKMQICDWKDLEVDLERLYAELRAGKALPFPMLSLIDSPSIHRAAAKLWVEQQHPHDRALGPIAKRASSAKIHVAYFSPDFRNHPIARLTAELFEIHDRSKFVVTAFAFGPRSSDPICARLERAFDHYIDVRKKSDIEVASLARSMGVDVAVDLAGFTEYCRTGIFALRAAPIQVSYLGYLGTMSVPYMDYLLADAMTIPAEERQHYSEKIIYLPSYQANDSKRHIADRLFTREELGLPREAFVFACFNANYKITPATFSIWMRILSRVPTSVLFIYAGDAAAERNLRHEAERRGVAPTRLVFGKLLAFAEYLARFRAMDLFLDTLPYNAGATASDALWAGLPVLTCMGRAFAGRVAGSLLTAIDLPELITHTAAQYEEMAVKLATNPGMLARIREKLAVNRTAAPLFNTVKFARNLETAYISILDRHHAGLAPDDIHVSP